MTYMTTKQVALRLNVCVDTVKHWCRSGALAGAFKLQGRAGWRIPVQAVDRLIEARQ